MATDCSSPQGLRRSPTGLERCPLCNQRSQNYYCKECVRNGTFYHSRMRLPERYADKRLRYLRFRRETEALQVEVENAHDHKTRHLLLREKTAEVRDRVRLLQLVLQESKENLVKVRTETLEVAKENKDRRAHLPVFQDRLKRLLGIISQYQKKIAEKSDILSLNERRLKCLARWSIQEAHRYIFPITEIKPPESSESDTSSTAWALAEALQTTYVRGRWIYTDASHETQYRVVEPLLPGSGDYSAYNMAVLTSGGGVGGSSGGGSGGGGEDGGAAAKEERGGGYNICAGLTYLAQLVSVLAFYLDMTLPKKLCYSDFCKSELSEQQFARRVAHLNANALYLCLSQGVPPSLLRPSHTVANVLALLDSTVADLGRQGSFEIPSVLVESLEEEMEGMEEGGGWSDTEDEEDTDTLSAEWETVPHLPPLDSTTTHPLLLPPSQPPTHQAPSTFASTTATFYSQAMGGLGGGAGGAAGGGGAGGLVTSAAASVMSLFRGLGGGHHK